MNAEIVSNLIAAVDGAESGSGDDLVLDQVVTRLPLTVRNASRARPCTM